LTLLVRPAVSRKISPAARDVKRVGQQGFR